MLCLARSLSRPCCRRRRRWISSASAYSPAAPTIQLAHEEELQRLYPDCERGAMPPFGPLYKQRVFVDTALSDELEIVFNAGTHTDAIRMRYADFADMTKPLVGSFGERLSH